MKHNYILHLSVRYCHANLHMLLSREELTDSPGKVKVTVCPFLVEIRETSHTSSDIVLKNNNPPCLPPVPSYKTCSPTPLQSVALDTTPAGLIEEFITTSNEC